MQLLLVEVLEAWAGLCSSSSSALGPQLPAVNARLEALSRELLG